MAATDSQLEALYRKRYGGFVETVATVCGGYERAHDAVQEGFARALKAKEQFNSGSLDAWVMRIALNAASIRVGAAGSTNHWAMRRPLATAATWGHPSR